MPQTSVHLLGHTHDQIHALVDKYGRGAAYATAAVIVVAMMYFGLIYVVAVD